MSLCFGAARIARVDRKITEEEYLSHLVAHFRGVRHPEDDNKELKSLRVGPFCLDAIGKSIRAVALHDNYQPIQGESVFCSDNTGALTFLFADATFLEELFQSCFVGNVDQVSTGLKQLKAFHAFPMLLQPLATVAAAKGHSQVLRICLDEGAIFDANVDSAVHTGLREPEMLDTLLAVNWHDMQHSQEPLTELVETVLFRDVRLLAWLFEHGAKATPQTIRSASSHHATEVSTMALLVKNCGISSLKDLGTLQLAAARGRLDMVEYLLDAGADIEEKPPWLDPRESPPATALYEAVKIQHVEMVRVLLQHGALVNRPYPPYKPLRETPLEAAERLGNSQILDLLKTRAEATDVGEKSNI